MTTIIQQLRDAQAAGDAMAYYAILEQNGDDYGRLAGGVVMSDALGGTVARAFAASLVKDVLNYELTGAEWAQISLGLIAADLAAREAKVLVNGDPLNLGYSDIQLYHNVVFDGLGIPRDAWTANIPLNQSSDPEATWQSMLQMPDDWFWGMLSGAGSFIDTINETLLATRYLILNPIAPFDPPDRTTISDELYWGWHAMNAFAAATQDGWGWGTSGSVRPFSVDLPDGGKFIGGADQMDDVLAGTAGNDVIVGYRGNDILGGTYGHDHVYGGEGDDYVHAGPDGGDFLVGGTNGADGDTVHFNANWHDYAILALDGGYSFTLKDSQQEASQVFEFENYDFADVQDAELVVGSAVSEDLQGGIRSDVIIADGGDDTVNAGDGDDVIDGGTGNDVIDGGAGTDKAYYSGNMADYGIAIVGEKVVLTDSVASRDGVDTLTKVEEFVFADGSILWSNLPKAPTDFEVWHTNIHTHSGLPGAALTALHVRNIVDADGGIYQLVADPATTDPYLYSRLASVPNGHMKLVGGANAGIYQVGLYLFNAETNTKSDVKVIQLEVHENVAPTGLSAYSASIVENIGGYAEVNVIDPNGSEFGGNGETFSARLVGEHSNTYALSWSAQSSVNVLKIYSKDVNLIDYEASPDHVHHLQIEITDMAGNVATFGFDMNITDTPLGVNWAGQGQVSSQFTKNGTGADDILDASLVTTKLSLNGYGGGDLLIGGRGNDRIDGGNGSDVMYGKGGDDLLLSYAGSDTIYGNSGFDTVDLAPIYRPQYVDDAYMSGGFLVIESGDTVVKIYNDVEKITTGVPWVGNLSWNMSGYLAEFNSFHP